MTLGISEDHLALHDTAQARLQARISEDMFAKRREIALIHGACHATIVLARNSW